MTTVILTDAHNLGYCSRAMRPWFEQHGLDWFDFVNNGIDAEKLLATEDDFAVKAVEAAAHREKKHGL